MSSAATILLLSSSRGGSSVFAETLRRSQALRHLPGEVNPLLRVAGLGWPDAGTDSDALGAEHAEGPRLRRFLDGLAAQAGWPGTAEDDLLGTVDARLRWQWPTLDLDPAEVAEAVREAEPLAADPPAFTRRVLRSLARRHPVSPALYDLPPAPGDVARVPDRVLEEPPFVRLGPWRRVEDPGLPLVIKAPSNAYRLDFFARALPGVRLLHLTRNPAAAINGLVDGWHHPGFHAHLVPGLTIADYSDHVPGGDRWWKFDLPPGWRAWTAAPLLDVAAFQWGSAHRAVLAWTAAHPEVDVLRVRFEDFLTRPEPTLERVCAWLGVPFDAGLRAVARAGLPPVMATSAPRQRRWFDRAELLEPVLARPDVGAIAAALDYPDPRSWV